MRSFSTPFSNILLFIISDNMITMYCLLTNRITIGSVLRDKNELRVLFHFIASSVKTNRSLMRNKQIAQTNSQIM